MIPLFLGLTLSNLAILAIAAVLGYRSGHGDVSRSWHLLAGVGAVMVSIAVHCVVFTYFIATAKWVRHAVAVKGLDAGLIEPTRSFRAQAFPAALLAMGSVIAAAMFGAAADSYGVPGGWHHAAVWAAIAVNVLMAGVELNAISRNGALIDRVLAEAAAADAARGRPPAESTIV